MVAAPDLHALWQQLPDGAVLGPDEDLAAYQTPWRGDAGRTAFVVRPGTVDEVQTVLRWAVRHRTSLVIQGANTGLVGASVPGVAGTTGVLSTERMTDPLEVYAEDRAVTAAAGVRLSRIAEATERHGLELPIDLAADATVGGIVATNAGGARVLRHGDVRRRLLGVQLVLADDEATVLGDLRPLRKKNDDLRLTDLAVGSTGLLGVVTAVTLELARRPLARATALAVVAGPLTQIAGSLERSLGTGLGALELISGAALRLTVEHVPDATDPFPGRAPEIVLLIEAEGPDAADDLLGALDQLGDLVADAVVLPPERAWALRHSVTEALARAGQVMGLDVALPRPVLEQTRAEVRAIVDRTVPGATLADFGHVGDGGLHLNVVLPRAHDPAAAGRLRHEVYAVVTQRGGSFSAEHGIGPANLTWWRQHSQSITATAAVKRALDPYGLLGTDALRAALTEGGPR